MADDYDDRPHHHIDVQHHSQFDLRTIYINEPCEFDTCTHDHYVVDHASIRRQCLQPGAAVGIHHVDLVSLARRGAVTR